MISNSNIFFTPGSESKVNNRGWINVYIMNVSDASPKYNFG